MSPKPGSNFMKAPLLTDLSDIFDRLRSCTIDDRRKLLPRVRRFDSYLRDPRSAPGEKARVERAEIDQALREAEQRVQARRALVPAIVFPEELPVSQRRDEIKAAISSHQVVVVCGETGSGKTTQLPKICLELGRGIQGLIGHTQPRRIAARSVATRIAEELGTPLGEIVGYKVRFGDRTGPNTLVKLMTDGILLAESQHDRFLDQYDTLIIDEAHERSLNIDFLLGFLKTLLPRRRDLKVIITSATIDPQRFADHFSEEGVGAVPPREHNGKIGGEQHATRRNNSTTKSRVPMVMVSGRTYPVELRYRPPAGRDLDERDDAMQDAIVNAVDELALEGPGDILIFLSGEREIRETAECLRKHHVPGAPGTAILPLYAKLSAEEQMKVFSPHRGRRIVLATNVAETSLTVPGIRYVIDPGFARINRYSPRTKIQRLEIEPVSRASADQRKGRCGRIAPGICIRLYDEADYAQRPEFTDPEIVRTNLASVILQMLSLKLGLVEEFPFLDPPEPRQLRDGYETLFELGAVSEAHRPATIEHSDPPPPVLLGGTVGPAPIRREPEKESDLAPTTQDEIASAVEQGLGQASGQTVGRADEAIPAKKGAPPPVLMPIGRELAKLPIDPRVARMILAGMAEHCLPEVLVIAAAMSVQDPRERPMEASAAADEKHLAFKDASSDFYTYLNIWKVWREHKRHLSSSKLRAWCKSNYLSFVRLREWEEVFNQLSILVAGMSRQGHQAMQPSDRARQAAHRRGEARRLLAKIPIMDPHEQVAAQREIEKVEATHRDHLHRALLTGLFSTVGFKTEQGDFLGARGIRFHIFPGSTLFKQSPKWVMAGEIVTTTRTYARTVAGLNPEWIEDLGKHILKKSHQDPQWNQSSGRVMANERVTLFGLEIVAKRRVHYGPINPAEAREIFIVDALVHERMDCRLPFFEHNRKLIASLREMEVRSRRQDLTLDSESRYAFFDAHIPRDVYAASTFERWYQEVSRANKKLLYLTNADLIAPGKTIPTKELYPDVLVIPNEGGGADLRLPLEYRLEPGSPKDGLTLRVPIEALGSITSDRLSWLVPGRLPEKIETLMKALPKGVRRLIPSTAELSAACVKDLKPGNASLTEAVIAWVEARAGVYIPDDALANEFMPEHLLIRLEVFDEEGKVIAAGRDLTKIRTELAPRLRKGAIAHGDPKYTRDNLKAWDFGDLPERIELRRAGIVFSAYPGLEDKGTSVSLRLFDTPKASEQATRAGLRRLFLFEVADELRRHTSYLPGIERLSVQFAGIGSPQVLKDALQQLIAERAFLSDRPPIRTEQAFVKRVDEGFRQISGGISKVMDIATRILGEYSNTEATIRHYSQPGLVNTISDIREQMGALFPVNFLVATPWDWLQHYPRYLQAVQMRLRKLGGSAGAGGKAAVIGQGLERDARLAAEVQPYWKGALELARRQDELGLNESAVREYRWAVEEFRVSLFAQELGTVGKVSAKRLQEMWEKVVKG